MLYIKKKKECETRGEISPRRQRNRNQFIDHKILASFKKSGHYLLHPCRIFFFLLFSSKTRESDKKNFPRQFRFTKLEEIRKEKKFEDPAK